MSTLQNITQPPSRFRSGRFLALVATGLVLVVAAVTIIAIAASDNGKSTPPAPAPAAAVSAPRAASGPSQGLGPLVRAHIRHER
jgi:hypothetical protein